MSNNTYGTPEYDRLLSKLRAAVKALDAAEAEEATYNGLLPGFVVQKQALALTEIKQCAVELTAYFENLGNSDDVPF